MNRRGFLAGAIGFLAAPAIVRAGSLMPVKATSLLDFEVGGRSMLHFAKDGLTLWRDNAGLMALRNGWVPMQTRVYRMYEDGVSS